MTLLRRGEWNSKKKAEESGVDTGADSLLDILDLLPDLTGKAGEALVVNSAEDDIETAAIPSITGLLDETAHDLLDHTGLTGVIAPNFKTRASATNDIEEFLNKKVIAGTGITITEVHPTDVTITDEEHADYAAFVIGESIVSGSRFRLTAVACDTTDNYFEGVKGSAIVASDVFEDVGNTTAIYIGFGANCTQLSISLT